MSVFYFMDSFGYGDEAADRLLRPQSCRQHEAFALFCLLHIGGDAADRIYFLFMKFQYACILYW